MIIPFCGTVIQGTKRAATTGYPTANVPLKNALIEDGTYKINVVVGSTTIPGMGVFFKDRELFEAHLFGFQGDLYGQHITIYPLRKMRENISFKSQEEVTTQLDKDKQTAMEKQIRVLTFGTFDHFHEGHKHYLTIARRYGDSLITIIALDETVKTIKGITPTHTQQERVATVQASGIPTHVLLGDPDDHYSCFTQRHPDVICLGYDQHSFDGGILEWYSAKELEAPQIVRIDSHHPDTFKSSFYRE